MNAAPIPANETERLAVLRSYDILDTEPESDFDEITRLASFICGTPISVMSLVDANRQWFKSRVGLDATETPREHAFCAHTILAPGMMIVRDAQQDARFAANPLVTAQPHIRFYAGVPLVTPEGYPLGSLCAIDRVPRELTPGQREALETLARQAIKNMQLRIAHAKTQELAQRLARMVEAKDRLFAIVAHDLKSPFSGVLGMLELLTADVERMDKKAIQRDLAQLTASAANTFSLIQNLLEWSAFETGEIPYRPTSLSLDELAREVVALLASGAAKKSVAITVQPNAGLLVQADRGMLHSILQNLVSNAVKFSNAGGEVTISSIAKGAWAEVSVADRGVGMSAETLSRILRKEPGNSSYGTDGERGTGLGLNMAQKFIERHGGRFSGESTPGQGTVFRFTLPLAHSH